MSSVRVPPPGSPALLVVAVFAFGVFLAVLSLSPSVSCSAIPPATAGEVCATAREVCAVANSLCALAPGGRIGAMTTEERTLRTRIDSLALVLASQATGR